MKKEVFILCLAICMLFALSSVCAGEVNDELAASNNTDQIIENEDTVSDVDDGIISSSQNEEIVSVRDNGTFKALQNKIDNADEGSTVILENDYFHEEGFTGAVTIKKSLTIDGKDFALNGDENQIFFIESGNVLLKNINFWNCHGSNRGSAISIGEDANVEVLNCSFNNCYSEENGGAIYIGNGKITKCTFDNCYSKMGGAIEAYAGESVLIDECQFTNCYSDRGGAIDCASESQILNISNSTFMNCLAHEGRGGAISATSRAYANNCNFTNCTAYLRKTMGGALYNVFSTDCLFDGADINGTFYEIQNLIYGADEGDVIDLSGTYIGVEYDMLIEKSICINGNGAVLDGNGSRAFVIDAQNVTIKSISFTNCSDALMGSCIFIDNDSSADILNCNFTNCNATYAAGIHSRGNNALNVLGCSFINCSGYCGGAVRVECLSPEDKIICNITDSSFLNCHSELCGGAVRLEVCDGDIHCNINNCSFVKCYTDDWAGGAIVLHDNTYLNVYGCRFRDCYARETGAAIFSFGPTFYVFKGEFDNCTTMYSKGVAAALSGGIYTDCIFDGVKLGLWLNTDDEFSTDEKDLDRVFASLSVPSDTNGRAVFKTVDGIIYNKKLSDFEMEYVNGTTYNITLKDEDRFIFDGCNDGDFIGFAFYDHNDREIIFKYYMISLGENTIRFSNVESPVDTKLAISISNITYGSQATINITAIPTFSGKVTVQLNNKDYTVDVLRGSGNKTISGLSAGTYHVKAVFAGTPLFGAATKTADFTVNKMATSITASNVATTYMVNKNLIITLKDSQGKPLSGVQVSVNIKGVKKLTTDKNGQAKFAVGSLIPNSYNVKISFDGNSNYKASSKTVKVTVKKATPKLTAKAKTFKKSVKTKKYSITLKNNQNKAMKNTKVTIKINKKTYTAKTNSKGVATFKIKLSKKGTFKSTVTYKGDNCYNKVTKTVKIKVK